MLRRFLLVLVGLSGSWGCSSASSDVPAPQVAAAPASPAERVRAAVRSVPANGAFRLGGVSHVAVTENGQTVEALDETTTVERSVTGTIHARYGNSREYGRELFVDGGKLWIRPLYGKYHLRPLISPEEGKRLVDEAWGTLAAQVELVLPWAQIEEKAGRITLSLGGKPAHPPAGWRGQAVVDQLSAELTVEDGAVVSGKLAARLRFVREGRNFTMELSSEHQVKRGEPQALALPTADESATSHEVSSEWRERVELLSGIAPPPKRGPE